MGVYRPSIVSAVLRLFCRVLLVCIPRIALLSVHTRLMLLGSSLGGVVGYARTTYTGEPVIGFDMVRLGFTQQNSGRSLIHFSTTQGGTSTDVSRFDGHYEQVYETVTAGTCPYLSPSSLYCLTNHQIT